MLFMSLQFPLFSQPPPPPQTSTRVRFNTKQLHVLQNPRQHGQALVVPAIPFDSRISRSPVYRPAAYTYGSRVSIGEKIRQMLLSDQG